MILTHSVNLPTVKLPNSALSGVQLTTEKDYKHYILYEARLPANSTVPLRSPDKTKSLHLYYCISGKGTCQTAEGVQKDVNPDTLVALSSDGTYELHVSAEGTMRLLVVYYSDVQGAYCSLAVVRNLSDLIGTERDISWGSGRSRRYLIRQDGFPLGLHNTWVYPKTSSRLSYVNHIESVYIVSGQITLRWKDANDEWLCENSKVDKENGTNYLLDMHDRHVIQAQDENVYCISIFDPVLTGKEAHNLTEDGFSEY